MARPDPQLLMTWTVVARMGSINAAAESLGLTQPAVSNQLRRLQEWLGEPLYRRHGRGVTPTALGKRLLRIASQIEGALADAETLRTDVQGLMQGSLLLVASQTNAEILLLRAMAIFQKRYPMITVRLQSGNSEEARRRIDVADLAFVEDAVVPESVPGITGKTLIETDIHILLNADHPLAQRPADEPVAIGELDGVSVVWREPGSGTRERVEVAFRQVGLEPEIRYEFSAGAAVREAVRCGLGVGFVSALSAMPADLCTRPVTPRIVQALSVIYQGPLSRPGEAFLMVLEDMIRAGAYTGRRREDP
ncbi:LysR substrate-binding domain-containing protein [Acidiferrobacter sp.]|uniref:LysR substrate-binding domain-containing protein n=1 Tax=Acidiferrobacter sp. TaxID=1872107 RepID=UPI00260A7342|nr:LysR substrate-binding domain-containing protein [Acidiferrobacter sp.]